MPRRHGELVLDMTARLLSQAGISVAELDGLAVGRGPGSFTGVRIATGVAQGLAYGAALAVAPVSSLRAVAQRAYRICGAPRVLVAFDARMGEVYWGAYAAGTKGRMEPTISERVCAPEEVPIPADGDWLGVGRGWSPHGASLSSRLGRRLSGIEVDRYPHAEEVASLGAATFDAGAAVPAASVTPVYLRERVAQKKGAGG